MILIEPLDKLNDDWCCLHDHHLVALAATAKKVVNQVKKGFLRKTGMRKQL